MIEEKTIVDHPSSSAVLSNTSSNEERDTVARNFEKQIASNFTIAGRYQLKEVLGHGGQATVYKLLINRPVAIKLMKQQGLSKQKTFESAIREASLAANINHPNVVKIL